MEKTKNGVVCTQKHEAEHFARIVKISLCSEFLLCSEISIHSENLAILAKISLLLLKFRYVAKFR